jgi:hypothetical protein
VRAAERAPGAKYDYLGGTREVLLAVGCCCLAPLPLVLLKGVMTLGATVMGYARLPVLSRTSIWASMHVCSAMQRPAPCGCNWCSPTLTLEHAKCAAGVKCCTCYSQGSSKGVHGWMPPGIDIEKQRMITVSKMPDYDSSSASPHAELFVTPLQYLVVGTCCQEVTSPKIEEAMSATMGLGVVV